MNKAELKQEAEEKAKKRTKGFKCQENCEKSYVMGALDFAEPREKQIDELKAQIKVLGQNLEDTEICENGLKNRIAELEAQIEKMKCCSNCDNWNWKHSKCEKKLKGDCFKASKWILRR